MNSEIIAVGHELLMGEITDTNTAFLAGELSKVSVPVRWSAAVGDDINDLVEAITRAHERSDVLIMTGGLGPTSDDLTREAVANALGEEMTVDASLLAWLEGVFRGRGTDMPRTNLKQAMLIPSATTIPNPQGTAPGWWVKRNGRHIIILPGPPRELQPMWHESIAPELAQLSGVGTVITRTLKTAGLSEGALDELLAGLFGRENPYLGIYAHQEGIHLRMIARAQDEQAAQALIAPMEADIRAAVGTAIWGVDGETPGQRAAELLCNMGLTLGVIEGASAGAIASQLAHIPDNGAFFKGSLITNRDGQVITPSITPDGTPLVSGLSSTETFGEDRALAMADAARKLFGSDVGLALTVPAGPHEPSRPASGEAVARETAAWEPEGVYYTAITSDSFQRAVISGPRLRISYSRPATIQRSATAALVELVAALEANK